MHFDEPPLDFRSGLEDQRLTFSALSVNRFSDPLALCLPWPVPSPSAVWTDTLIVSYAIRNPSRFPSGTHFWALRFREFFKLWFSSCSSATRLVLCSRPDTDCQPCFFFPPHHIDWQFRGHGMPSISSPPCFLPPYIRAVINRWFSWISYPCPADLALFACPPS